MSVTLGGQGAYLNLGAPGTGISYRKRIKRDKPPITPATLNGETSSGSAEPPYPEEVEYALNANLELELENTLTDRLLGSQQREAFLADHEDEVEAFLDETAEHLSRTVEGVGDPHLSDAVISPTFSKHTLASTTSPDERTRPLFPTPPELLPGHLKTPPIVSGEGLRRYRDQLGKWLLQWQNVAKMVEDTWAPYSDAQAEEIAQSHAAERRMAIDPECFAKILTERLATVPWPRETIVDCEIGDVPESVFLSVDLPEIEDLPTEGVVRTNGALTFEKREFSDMKRQAIYQHCVLSIAATVIRIVFDTAPHVRRLSISGYTQRPDGNGGNVDRTILKIELDRDDYEWNLLNLFIQTDLSEMVTMDWCHIDTSDSHS